jgi:hypothetical protein
MKFEFFKDTLGTIWYRDCVEVEADSYEEAKQKVIDAVENYDDLEVIYSEPIWETWNETSIKENDECATLEIQNPETAEIIYKNGK